MHAVSVDDVLVHKADARTRITTQLSEVVSTSFCEDNALQSSSSKSSWICSWQFHSSTTTFGSSPLRRVSKRPLLFAGCSGSWRFPRKVSPTVLPHITGTCRVGCEISSTCEASFTKPMENLQLRHIDS